jgi:hypothetical protein
MINPACVERRIKVARFGQHIAAEIGCRRVADRERLPFFPKLTEGGSRSRPRKNFIDQGFVLTLLPWRMASLRGVTWSPTRT